MQERLTTVHKLLRERERERERDRQTDRQTDNDRHTERESEKERERMREREKRQTPKQNFENRNRHTSSIQHRLTVYLYTSKKTITTVQSAQTIYFTYYQLTTRLNRKQSGAAIK